MPSGAQARVIGLLDKLGNLVEGGDVFGVLAEGKLDLGLIDYRVDTAQPVGLCVGQQAEPSPS
jgi:hypothetical protein